MRSPTALKRKPVPQSKEVLLLIDVINPLDFPTAEDLLPSALVAARSIAKFKARLAGRGIPAIYANDNYGTWHSEFSEILAACRKLPGERGEIARLLTPLKDDLVILKPGYSAFQFTPLQHLLDKMKVKKISIVGLAADICVMLSAIDASAHGYKVWVPRDCTAAESLKRKDDAIRQLKTVFGCSVQATAAGA